jgi:AmmeMemoRadiSam system protein B/AmmeMemoRadiSam system protein A
MTATGRGWRLGSIAVLLAGSALLPRCSLGETNQAENGPASGAAEGAARPAVAPARPADGQSARAEAPTVGERRPAVAARFYPGAAKPLEGAVRAYLEDALPPQDARPLALISPHAGYIYSGQIAADAYRQAMGHEYDVIVVLGTNHTTAGFDGVSIYPGTGYRTPLGLAEIDRELASRLTAADPAFTYQPAVHTQEHSVEVQIPFVQVAFPGIKIVTAVVGRPEPELCVRLGKALVKVLEGRKPLIVASSDLSHYPDYGDAVPTDLEVLEAIVTRDPFRVHATMEARVRRGVPGLSTSACGEAPILAVIQAARDLGAGRGIVISYANSGDTAVGDHSRVVGYGAVAFLHGDSGPTVTAPPPVVPAVPKQITTAKALEAAERRALLAFARESIERFLTTQTAPLARGYAPSLAREQGVFVTLKKNGHLRGCRGSLRPDLPLYQLVGVMALQSAFNDPRFPAVERDEWDAIDLEISLLTPMKPVPGVESVRVGRDGVWLGKNGRSAVYLPEVAVEMGWDRAEMMDHLCRKAGLPVGCWRQGATLETFQSELLKEAGTKEAAAQEAGAG